MQCHRCQMVLPEGTAYCYGCGASQSEPPRITPQPAIAPQSDENATVASPMQPAQSDAPTLSPPSPQTPVPTMEAGWAEFSGMPTPAPAFPYPPAQPAPGAYGSAGAYPYYPGTIPPIMPAPKRRGGTWLIVTLAILIPLLAFGGVFVGIRIGQENHGVTSTPATANASSTPDANQLYQQVTRQNPTFADSLHDGSLSSWSVFEKPTYGCELAADGLHVHTQDSGHFGFCSSGRGKFSDFAFQVDMDILTGAGGGITFRSDSSGNMYFFQVLPHGAYQVYTEKANKAGDELAEGAISSYVSGFNQKNTLTVIAQSSHMYFYANQKFLTMVQDSSYTSGYLGVLAYDSTSQAEVVYTNAKAWRL